MEYFKAVIAGVVGSGLFWLIDTFLLSLSPAYKTSGVIIMFLIGAVAYKMLSRNMAVKRVSVMSNTDFKDSLDATIDETQIDGDESVSVLSGNKVRGPANLTISKSDIGS
ncbi:MAG TPA: hypothetical protein VFZ91_06310 [Allosphingosinicella sp.]